MRAAVTFCIFVAALVISATLYSPTSGERSLSRERIALGSTACAQPAERLWYSAQFELLRTRDPRTGMVPADIRGRELAYASTLPLAATDAVSLRKLQRSAFVPGWMQRGPSRIAGRMLDLLFDKDDDNILYAGSASGGFWKSDDRGGHWRKTTPADLHQTVGCIVQDTRPGQHAVLYYGTGELLSTTDRSIHTTPRTTGYGNGIYRSSDRGEHWVPLASTLSSTAGNLQSPFQGVWNLAIASDGWDAGALYAACYGQILRSFDEGATWEHVLGDAAAPPFSTDIVFTPVLSYAAVGGFTISSGTPLQRGVFLSTDRRDWVDITPQGFPSDARVVKLAAAPSDPYVLYVLTETPAPYPDLQLAFTASRHTLWKHTYSPITGTGSWEQRTASLPEGGIGNAGNSGLNSLGGYCLTMAVHPDDPNLLFVGGTSLYRSTNAFRTGNNTVIAGGYPYSWADNELHPDQHALAFLPSDPARLYVANDGGVQFTPNCRAGNVAWTIRNEGLISSQFYRVAQDPLAAEDPFLIGGLQDNATYYSVDENDAADWRGVIGGDGMSVAVAPDKDFVLASVYTGRIFSFILSPDLQPQYMTYQTGGQLPSKDFAFFTVFTLDPFNGHTLYVGGLPTLWRKEDISLSAHDQNLVDEGWVEIRDAAFPSPDYISAIGCASDASGRMYIGSSGGGLLRIDNARGSSPSAVPLTSPMFPAGGYVSCVAVDPRDADRLFAVFSNYNVQSLFFSSDAGSTWATVGGNLEEHPDGSGAGPSVRWLAILPMGSGEMLFAATSSGLYSTTAIDGMQTQWMRESPEGIGALCVDHVDARAVDGSIIVATQGGGVWAAHVAGINAISPPASAVDFELLSVWPQPMKESLQVRLRTDKQAALQVMIHDLQGRTLLREQLRASGGEASFSFDVHAFQPGVYFLSVDDGSQRKVVKLMKIVP
ncbi:MAG: T9SS type A sorting domain-containing protein [Bacteroidota bacterium]